MIENKSTHENTEEAKSNSHRLSWKILSLRIFGVYVLFSVLSHIYDPARIPSDLIITSTDKIIFFYVFSYVIYFTMQFAFISILFFASKIFKRFRTIPNSNMLNKSLITTFVISMLLLYGGWHGNKKQVEWNSIGVINDPITANDKLQPSAEIAD